MTQKHTPGPWTIDEAASRHATPIIIAESRRGQSREVVKVLHHMGSEDPEVWANAEFIVRACNSHYKLLEACEEMTESFCSMCKRLNPQHEDCTSCEEMDSYKRAIAKATES